MIAKDIQASLSGRLLVWWDVHGRTELPWQRDRDPYRVWLSEIMLQQTQVQTVIPYFERFLQAFPTITALADAAEDAVLHQWTGLGYYARARNLHKAAQQMRDHHHGQMPEDFDDIVALPGIGRSTAGAICSFCFNQRRSILDGNVKRVLARVFKVPGWPGQTQVARRLWQLADENTPSERVADYTQAIMDLGAMVCVRSRPLCSQCPLSDCCAVAGTDAVAQYPGRKPKKVLPEKKAKALIVSDESGRVLLERRPPAGVWGGLWSFPQCEDDEDEINWFLSEFGIGLKTASAWPASNHTFSHYRLALTPIPATIEGEQQKVTDGGRLQWYDPDNPDVRGLAAPVRRLLGQN